MGLERGVSAWFSHNPEFSSRIPGTWVVSAMRESTLIGTLSLDHLATCESISYLKAGKNTGTVASNPWRRTPHTCTWLHARGSSTGKASALGH